MVSDAVMFQPAIDMATGGVVVRPVDDAALGIPFVFTVELHKIALIQRINSRCHINIVGDQYRLARRQLNYKALMLAPFGVVGENFCDATLTFDLEITLLVFEGFG